MRFTFIHAADLHIDSPFAGLGTKDAAVAQRFARAGRAAVEQLIAETLASDAGFLIIAGDIYDGDWKDVSTGLFFARALGALQRAAIPVYMVKGNHDAASLMSRALPYPGTVHSFAAERAQSIALEQFRVMLHGRSFGTRKVADDFVGSYPARRDGWLNIGVLHTGLDGSRGHESYAPCTVEDLRRFGYDYWALGHIHAAEIVSTSPWIVYPGNLQGRSVRETGPKGAMRVTVEDGRIVEVTPLALDAARWLHEPIDVSACGDEGDALECIRLALARLHPLAGGRPLAIRFTLTGTSPAHTRLVARRERLEEEARALGFQFAEDCWVEQIKLATAEPLLPAAAAGQSGEIDLDQLLAASSGDPAFAAVLPELVDSIARKMPRELRDEFAPGDADAMARLAALARDYLKGELAS